MNTFSVYKNGNNDADLIVSQLAGLFSEKDSVNSIQKNASVKNKPLPINVISNLVNTLVKSAEGLEGSEHVELMSEIDATLNFINKELI